MKRTVYGVGFLGDGPRTHRGDTTAYRKWAHMLMRVYAPPTEQMKHDYAGHDVAKDWHNFQEFAEWYYTQPFAGRKGYELDKDLREVGNKYYSSDYCELIPAELNSLLSKDNRRNKYGVGVLREHKTGKFTSLIQTRGNRTYLGTFITAEEATRAYMTEHLKRLDVIGQDMLASNQITADQFAYLKAFIEKKRL